jgi:hypothetical protein
MSGAFKFHYDKHRKEIQYKEELRFETVTKRASLAER